MPAGRILVLLTLTSCLATSVVRAQAPKGNELRINSRTSGKQWLPDVATAADGHFVVVWKDGDGGADFTRPVFVMARLFDAAGTPRSGEIRVGQLKASPVPGAVSWPAVAMAADGRFVVVWQGGPDNPSVGFGRRFAADGRPLGPRFRLARSTEHSQLEPDVAMAPDGSFVAVWHQEDGGNARVNLDVFFRRFGADGRALGREAVAIGGFEEQSKARVALRPNGDFVVVCRGWTVLWSYDVVARTFSRSGSPLDDGFAVNDFASNHVVQDEPAIAVAADGRFAVAWTDDDADNGRGPNLGQADSTGVGIRFYSADGTALAPPRFANLFLRGAQGGPAISALQTGGFLVLWTGEADQDGDGSGIFARVYGADGRPRGGEVRINLQRTGSQHSPALAVAPDGKGAAVWSGPDGNATGIFARRIGKPQ